MELSQHSLEWQCWLSPSLTSSSGTDSWIIHQPVTNFVFRYFFLVLLALIILGIFNGLVFLPVLLVIVGPPAQVVANEDQDSLPPSTPQPSPVRFKARPPRPGPRLKPAPSSRSSHGGSHDNSGFTSIKHKRHNSDISLSTIAEENSHAASIAESVSEDSVGSQDGGDSSVQSSYNGTSVFLEPHITVETSTLPVSPMSCSQIQPKITFSQELVFNSAFL